MWNVLDILASSDFTVNLPNHLHSLKSKATHGHVTSELHNMIPEVLPF